MRTRTTLRWWRLDRWGIPLAYIAVMTVSAPAAMSICSAVASGMIALTGIVFSLTL